MGSFSRQYCTNPYINSVVICRFLFGMIIIVFSDYIFLKVPRPMITTPLLHGRIQGSYLFFRVCSLCFLKVFLSVPIRCPRDSEFSFGAAMTTGLDTEIIKRLRSELWGGGTCCQSTHGRGKWG